MCCNDYKNVTGDKKFLQSVVFFFWGGGAGGEGLVNSFLKYKKLFKLGARTFHFRKYNFLRAGSFYFLNMESYFLKYKKIPFPEIQRILLRFPFPEISEKLSFKKIFRGFYFLKYKNTFLWRNYKKSFLLRKYKELFLGFPFPEI